MLVEIDNETLKEMFKERVEFWTSDKDVINTFSAYYDNLIDDGCLDGMKLNIPLIVDNDYVNNLRYYTNKEEAQKDYDCEIDIVFECESGILVNP